LSKPFSSIPEALEDVRQGKLIVIVDDEDRENEGDLMIAAEKVTPEAINFMAKHGRGLICLALTEERTRELGLSMMVEDNQSLFETPFTISIDAKEGVTTGISAADRAQTIRVAIDPESAKGDLVKPGHIFPLRARDGGVLVRMGQTEASVDMARLAGLDASGVICEIMDDDGSMARVPALTQYAKTHGLKMITTKDLAEYRLHQETLVEEVVITTLPTPQGDFSAVTFRNVRPDPYRPGERGDRPGGADARARALAVPHRRRVRLLSLRLRRTIEKGHGNDREGGPGRPPVSLPGRPGHWHCQQAQGLRPAGHRAGHGTGQRDAGF
jgi:3,4-dihydroxy 2-butanone 4-phosphate synthase/GTP cyclohydrolase II